MVEIKAILLNSVDLATKVDQVKAGYIPKTLLN
jgi:hypothetical protein